MRRWRNDLQVAVAAVLLLFSLGLSAYAQQQPQVLAVSPGSAQPGETNVTVTFTLPNSTPPTPPSGVLPISVTIGAISGTLITHSTL
ncbi:MAG: hypothetical protein ISS35_04705, partial [Kiritimatiellae bacterium]|nr:hypothetical protein [Kiritimatiellia bacterium]